MVYSLKQSLFKKRDGQTSQFRGGQLVTGCHLHYRHTTWPACLVMWVNHDVFIEANPIRGTVRSVNLDCAACDTISSPVWTHHIPLKCLAYFDPCICGVSIKAPGFPISTCREAFTKQTLSCLNNAEKFTVECAVLAECEDSFAGW